MLVSRSVVLCLLVAASRLGTEEAGPGIDRYSDRHGGTEVPGSKEFSYSVLCSSGILSAHHAYRSIEGCPNHVDFSFKHKSSLTK